MDTDIDKTSDTKNNSIINNEFLRIKVDIVAFQETRIADIVQIRKDFMFIWHGKSVDERREHDVGFPIRNTFLQQVKFGSDGNERITILHLHNKKGRLTLVRVYAHTLYADEQVKDIFYEIINLIINKIPKHDQLCILGDFNVRVGADYDS